MKTNLFVSTTIVAVLVSAAVSAQEAVPAAEPEPVAVAAQETPAVVAPPALALDAAALAQADAELRATLAAAEAKAAKAEADAKAARAETSDAQAEAKKAQATADEALAKAEKALAELKKVDKRLDKLERRTGFQHGLAAGLVVPVSDGQAAGVVQGNLGPMFAGYVFGHGVELGFDIFRTRIGRVDIRMLGLGGMIYGKEGKELILAEYPRTWDLIVKPVDVNVRVWNNKRNNLGVMVGGALSWLLPSPSAAYDSAERELNGIEDTSGLETAGEAAGDNINTVDPMSSSASTGGVETAAMDKVDDARSKGDAAADAMGDIYGSAFGAPVIRIYVGIKF